MSVGDEAFTDANKSVYFRYTVKCVGHVDHMELDLPVKNAPVEKITIEFGFDGETYGNPVTIDSKAGRWVGVKNGAYIMHDANVKNDETGYVTLDYVRYENI